MLGVLALGIAIPSTPARLGVYGVAVVGALSIFGVPFSVALAIALVSHLIHLSITSFVGMYGFFCDGETVIGLYKHLRNVCYMGETS